MSVKYNFLKLVSKLLQKLAECYKFSTYKEKQMVLL